MLLLGIFTGAELWVGPHVNASGLRSAIESAIALSALLSAILLRARFQHTRLLRDLWLLGALATVAATRVVFGGLPAPGAFPGGAHGLGTRMTLMVVIASAFLAVAFTPARRRLAESVSLTVLGLSVVVAFVALAEVIGLILGTEAASAYGSAMNVVSVVTSLCLLISVARLHYRRMPGEVESGALAGAAFLLAGAWLQRVRWSPMSASWVTLGDVARLIAYALLLTAAVRMYNRTREQQAREAIDAERLRIARDLHDGLAQDLAFIVAHGNQLALDLGTEHPLTIAARRALAASRGTIVDLEASNAPTTEAALREVSAELATRFGVEVTVNIEAADGPDLSVTERRELVRIAREAIANAVQHGGALNVAVTLGSRRGERLLRVVDDGCGLATPQVQMTAGTGLGMRTMRARAAVLGGRLIARSADRGGTDISVITLAHDAQPSV